MYKHGDHLALCDVCGFPFHRSQLKRTWNNLLVCGADYEPRHPQDTIRIRPERNKVKDSRPEPDENFLSPGDVTGDDL
jgi:hypothetical protein